MILLIGIVEHFFNDYASESFVITLYFWQYFLEVVLLFLRSFCNCFFAVRFNAICFAINGYVMFEIGVVVWVVFVV